MSICLCLSLTGSFPDAQLPSKRILGPKNYEFLTSKREEFQEYLQVLMMEKQLFQVKQHVLYVITDVDFGCVSLESSATP